MRGIVDGGLVKKVSRSGFVTENARLPIQIPHLERDWDACSGKPSGLEAVVGAVAGAVTARALVEPLLVGIDATPDFLSFRRVFLEGGSGAWMSISISVVSRFRLDGIELSASAVS